MWFTRISIRNPVFATMMMAACLVLGVFSYQRLAVEQFPDVSVPVIIVQTVYPGAAPEIVERDVTRPLEEAINAISGLRYLSSTSYESLSVITAEFDLGIDAARAAEDVRDKVALVQSLFRPEVEEPRIYRFNPADLPILALAVRGEASSLRDLTTIAEAVFAPRIQNILGVGQVTLVGGAKPEIQVLLKPGEMQALGVGVEQVIGALRGDNLEVPAGSLRARDSERPVLLDARIAEPERFGRIVVGHHGDRAVHLSDVATIVDGEQEAKTAALVNGQRVVALDVVKARGANTTLVVDQVRKAIEELNRSLPPGVRIEIVRDTSKGIRASVADVRNALIEGAVLTVLVVFLFLGSWRSTVIVGLALPISLVGTFFVMYALGFTINLLTLMALSMSIGLLIDDAIVVRENIVRHAAMGKDRVTAALDGTREIGLAVAATTFTIVAVFLPVAFMAGIIGRFFYQFGVTVSAAVLISMFVSFTLDPMLSSVWADPDAEGHPSRTRIGRLLAWGGHLLDRLGPGYERLLAWALHHRRTVIAIALASFLGSFLLVPYIGSDFLPEADLGEVTVQLQTAPGSSLEFTERKVREAEAALRELPEVRFTYATLNTGTALGKNRATIFVELAPRGARKLNQKQLQRPMRERLAQIDGIKVTDVSVYMPLSTGKPLQVSVQGPDPKELERLSQEVLRVMKATPNAVDIDTSQKAARAALAVRVKRDRAADLGLSVGQIAAVLRPLVAGEAVSTWKSPDGSTRDIVVRLAAEDRSRVSDLDRIPLRSSLPNEDGSARMVTLGRVADVVPTTAVTQIDRKSLAREILVSANADERPVGDVSADVEAGIAKVPLPPGYRLSMGGAAADIEETTGQASVALVLAVVFIYMILASQFASFMQPLAIMASLPLSLVGVLVALLLTGSTINMFSIIGFILLMGLVTKNAILLVDFINRDVAEGKDRTTAIVEAGRVRLRPILMTTFAMIFGMLPLALGLGEGAEQRSPMAHAVIGGIISSTLLTLVVVPVLYSYLDDIGRSATRLWNRREVRGPTGAERPDDLPHD
ncbi:MAG: efflux RND transporter permease subunit [Burkholderiales bacterium]